MSDGDPSSGDYPLSDEEAMRKLDTCPKESEIRVLICTPVAFLPVPSAGSILALCDNCETSVWVGTTLQPILGEDALTRCLPCAMELDIDAPVQLAPGQVGEIFDRVGLEATTWIKSMEGKSLREIWERARDRESPAVAQWLRCRKCGTAQGRHAAQSHEFVQ